MSKNKKLIEYRVPVVYQSWGRVSVFAESEEDLLKKLSNPDFIDELPLPDDPSYVEDSYEIDDGGYAEDFNGNAPDVELIKLREMEEK